jgi:hypothetical protein
MLAGLGLETVDLEMGGQVVASHVPAADDADTADVLTEAPRQLG